MVQACEVPPGALLQRYIASGAYTDCCVTLRPGTVSQAQFVEAFYTTALFKLGRFLLRVFIARPATDADAAPLAKGQRDCFAA